MGGAGARDSSTLRDRDAWRKRLVEMVPLSLAVALVAYRSIGAVLAKVGHPGAALDDAYIHFQYARAIAEGHPLRFEAGEPITSGCTSMLWPLVLAPFWALGARGEAILWPAWALSYAALGALAWEAFQLTRPLAGRTAAVGAAALILSFAGYAWFAASGMEVVPFAWAIARASRRAAEWAERERPVDGPRRAPSEWELVGLAWAAALLRPEGAITALLVATTLVVFGRGPRRVGLGAAAAAATAFVPLLLWAVTGSPRSTTAVAKLLPGNPYYSGSALAHKVLAQAATLVGTLLGGEVWSAEFLPRGGTAVAFAGLAAVAVLGARTGRRWRAAAILLLAASMFAPCAYATFLWNRLRYLWPFATAWLIGLACLARLAGGVLTRLRASAGLTTGLLCGIFVGLFASKLDWALEDLAQSASGIDRQQVALGRWARLHLDPKARIGVNDTGAIAYFGERATFDVVGLTTADEARYWVAGPGSRWEHYERLGRSATARLPTHFIVYPQWMAMDGVLGAPLTEAVVTDASILGGTTMRAYMADWSALGSGELPWSEPGAPRDVVDVADLESEADHAYELLDAAEDQQVVHEGTTPDGRTVTDGGRAERKLERLVAHLAPGAAARGVVRVAGEAGSSLRVYVEGHASAALVLTGADWEEVSFDVPPELAGPHTRIELRAEPDAVTVFHYWFF